MPNLFGIQNVFVFWESCSKVVRGVVKTSFYSRNYFPSIYALRDIYKPNLH